MKRLGRAPAGEDASAATGDRMDEHEHGPEHDPLALNRRRFIAYFSSIGLGATLMPGAMLAVAQESPQITLGMVDEAARIAGLNLPPDAEKRIADQLSRKGGLPDNFKALRELKLGNDTPPAIVFNPLLPGIEAAGRPQDVQVVEAGRRQAQDRRGPGLPAGHAPGPPRREARDQVRRPDQALSRAAEEIRSDPPLRRHA